MTDRRRTLQTQHRFGIKDFLHQAHTLMDVQGGAVGRRNSGGFLPAVLEGIKSQIGELGRFYAAKYAKYAAFIVEVIVRQLKGMFHSLLLIVVTGRC
jgi:hypothetical protein